MDMNMDEGQINANCVINCQKSWIQRLETPPDNTWYIQTWPQIWTIFEKWKHLLRREKKCHIKGTLLGKSHHGGSCIGELSLYWIINFLNTAHHSSIYMGALCAGDPNCTVDSEPQWYTVMCTATLCYIGAGALVATGQGRFSHFLGQQFMGRRRKRGDCGNNNSANITQ